MEQIIYGADIYIYIYNLKPINSFIIADDGSDDNDRQYFIQIEAKFP